ncbi:MAG: ABC transporter ATP-binding protein [Deltaproteobacteria bacterium]|nr:MAG: ABC transporter ATP-binding protein [Deltaproteobacteria bacterium]
MASLEIDGVKKRFGAQEILKGIDISVDTGEFLVLVGPSGCGKSTLLNMIAGVDTISEGEIRVAGARVNELHPSERDIAMVFQSYALYPNMTVEQNIGFSMEMHKVPKAERLAAVREVAKILQLEELLKRRPSQLSGGQRQRVAMGRALVRKPKIFLFDEPLSNLDAHLRVDMRTEIKKLHQRLYATIVYVTHDQIEAMTLATRIAVMRAGELLQLGTPAQIYNRPANTFVAAFMGSPRMSLIPARLVPQGEGLVLEIQRGDRPKVSIPLPPQPPAVQAFAGREVIAGLRAEAISNGSRPAGNGNGAQRRAVVDGQVVVIEPTGPDTLVVLNVGGYELTARLEPDFDLHPGDRAEFKFDLTNLVLFDPSTEKLIA